MPKVVPEYKEKARERILEAALRVFSEKGYHEARMEDIADRLGVSKRTLYLYYKNKEELYKAICAEAPKAVSRMLQSCLAGREAGTACTEFFDLSTKDPPSSLAFEIIAVASRNSELRRTERDTLEHELEVVSKFVQGGRKKGAPSDTEAHQMARILLALYRGLMADLVLGVKKPEVREAWIKATDALLRDVS
jgi:AcrR family transcriptional regulator